MTSFIRPSLLLGAVACTGFSAIGCAHAGTGNPVPLGRQAGQTSTAPQARQSVSISRLGSYNVDPAKVFVAGISSGGAFGVQMHVAHSRTFKGAALYAGAVYDCAQDSVTLGLAECGGAGSYVSTLAQSETYLNHQSTIGTIDAAGNLKNQPVYLWSGTQDVIVNPKEMNDVDSEYKYYGAAVKYDNTFPAAHGWESPDGEVACGTLRSPYLIKCDSGSTVYDSERTWLTMFLGTLRPRNDRMLQGTVVHFDQTEFGASAKNSMDTNGYAFVPKPCALGQRCALVLALTGCNGTQADIGTKFITEGGIDPWADSNNIIVLYPFIVKSSPPQPTNPSGCWDWWGYDDPNYALKSGTQISIVYRMVQRVTNRQ